MKINLFLSGMVVLFTLLLLFTFAYTAYAQPPSVTGFWYTKKPQVPQAVRDGVQLYLENYLERLQILATIPVGEVGVRDVADNEITWDQAKLDAIAAEIAKVQGILAGL